MSEGLSEEKQEISKVQEPKIEKLGEKHTDSFEKREIDGAEEGRIDSHVVKQVIAKIESEFSGPIPPPNIIKGYEEVLPGSANRILEMAERQAEHRQKMEYMMIHAESRDSLLGIMFAFVLGIGCIITAVVTVITFPQNAGVISGAVIGVTGIGSIITAFIKSTRSGHGNSDKQSKSE